MQCTACHIESNDLRAYTRPHASERVRLCAACRVLNALHRRYLPVDDAAVHEAQLIADAMARRTAPGHAPRSGA
jgi:hypothetical protein